LEIPKHSLFVHEADATNCSFIDAFVLLKLSSLYSQFQICCYYKQHVRHFTPSVSAETNNICWFLP